MKPSAVRRAPSISEIRSLRAAVRESLRNQGFRLDETRLFFARAKQKASLRARHRLAVLKRQSLAKPALALIERELIEFIASGDEVDPQAIRPVLHKVEAGTVESQLFRYACLHWSIPISEGYGRRLRFLVVDETNGKLIGVLGLGDPVYSISARDRWIGWDADAKARRLYHVMDAYVLGAVPPYSNFLGGKLVALAAASNEVRQAFVTTYKNKRSLISNQLRKPELVLLTTTSALGRSSIYNRVKFRHRVVFRRVGYTGGWGEFHLSDGVYDRLTTFACKHCVPTAKQKRWGKGFRNRRELVRKALMRLDFSNELLNHGIRREVFVVPLVWNARPYLRGESNEPRYHNMPFASAARFWKRRWLLSRLERDQSYRHFNKYDWLIWNEVK